MFNYVLHRAFLECALEVNEQEFVSLEDPVVAPALERIKCQMTKILFHVLTCENLCSDILVRN